MAECYCFDQNGYLLVDTMTPDGYTVNEDGAWTDNGAVQTRRAETQESEKKTDAGIVKAEYVAMLNRNIADIQAEYGSGKPSYSGYMDAECLVFGGLWVYYKVEDGRVFAVEGAAEIMCTVPVAGEADITAILGEPGYSSVANTIWYDCGIADVSLFYLFGDVKIVSKS